METQLSGHISVGGTEPKKARPDFSDAGLLRDLTGRVHPGSGTGPL